MSLRDPKLQKILAAVVFIGVVSYVYFGTTYLPFNYPVRKAAIEQAETELLKLETELEKARQMIGNLAKLEAEYEKLHEQWIAAQELLPEEKEIPELLRQVTTAGNKSGVTFARFEPQGAVPRDFYTDHPINVRVRGGYHQIGIFMSRLANMPRIVNVTRLSLTQVEDKKKMADQRRAAQMEERRPPTRGRSSRQPASQPENKKQKITTVEADFVLTAYTLLGGIVNEQVPVAQKSSQ